MTQNDLPERAALIGRLFHVLERQVVHMEDNMDDCGEKEVALLGTIARNLDKLIDIEQKAQAQEPDRRRSKKLDQLRQKLSERISRLQAE